MHGHEAAPPSATEEGRRPRFEVADIFRDHGEVYRHSHALTTEQRKAMRDIVACRTAVLGGHLDVCLDCGFNRPAYNSCRNRHCPKCQALKQATWIDARHERILPTHYFHVVFTVPQELKALALRNPVRLYDLMFAAASETLLELGHDPERLGGLLGITAVLHTWTRALAYHPHIHCIVTGGGLAPNGAAWIPARRRFLFPVTVMGALFRGKILAALAQTRARGLLTFVGSCAHLADDAAFARWKHDLYRKSWVVYSKTPFGGPAQVFNYLGRYTHRVGISNQRLVSVSDRAVCFTTKSGGTCTLRPLDFIGRFLLHILPTNFVKIRHFGLLAPSNVNTKLQIARRLLAPSADPTAHLHEDRHEPAPTWRDLFLRLTGVDLARCPACTTGVLVSRPLPRAVGPPPRPP
ncbi:MAG TPA: IS91 family transposase [Pyrinomonadaceae bacterium]